MAEEYRATARTVVFRAIMPCKKFTACFPEIVLHAMVKIPRPKIMLAMAWCKIVPTSKDVLSSTPKPLKASLVMYSAPIKKPSP